MSSNYQLPLIKESHQNHYLFSDYYLNEIVPSLDEWKDETGLKEAFDEINKIYLKNLPRLELLRNERRNEDYFITPILRILNPYFELQPTTLSIEGKKRPDYAFFPDEKTKKEAGKKLIQEKYKEYFATAVAVGDAKYWDRPLDKKDTKARDNFTNANPNFQIDFYLRASDLKWGILTNGRLWRLYNRDTSYKLDSFYHVDLPVLIQQNDLEKFKYFYHFFKLQAFLPDAQGLTFLDRIFKESINYAIEIGDELENRVYEALEECAKGFLALSSNNLPIDKLEEIRENSLILLYRLLFILYAESRKLLPAEEGTSYLRNYSLESLKKEIAEKLDKSETLSSESNIYWSRLKGLFNIINKGDRNLDVHEYNGGLFKPERNEFLEKYEIGDSYLAKIIDFLARTPTKRGNEIRLDFVSYKDLEIRHLGSIYEGLLENKLKKAEEKKYVIKEKKKERVVSMEETKGKKVLKEIEPGEIYLATDKSERKATGSYYTPDYIVKYIVENTLEPLTKEKLPEEILELNVLDPAMGSGHFLVRATEFLAEAIATHPEVKTQVGINDENELNYWKRQVVERCIYGVDLNPLAVELAKLSLWLATVSKGKPLSFLDHHLRCGNSLIGARLKDLNYLPKKRRKKEAPVEQLSFAQKEWFKQDVWHFLKLFKEIEEKESLSKKVIDEKYQLFDTVEKAREKYKKIADLWISVYFGNAMDDAIYRSAIEGLRDEKQRRLSEKAHKEIFEKTEYLAKVKGFFHWELEFPEVFFDKYGREKDDPGFDSVIGNPPYGGQLDEYDRNFLSNFFKTAKTYKNTALQFIELSLATKQQEGSCGLIVPKSLTYSEGWSSGINLVLPNLLYLVDVSKAFEDVLLEQVVYICGAKSTDSYNSTFVDKTTFKPYTVIPKRTYKDCNTLITSINNKELEIYNKVTKGEVYLKNISDTFRGLPWQKYIEGSSGEKILRGDHIFRFGIIESKDFVQLDKIEEKSKKKIKLLRQPKIISQNVVAHVLYPKPHIIIMSTIDRNLLLNLDTVNSTVLVDKNLSLEFLLCILNCKITSWFAYRFIYNQAIRTMHFDETYVGKIPLPLIVFNTQLLQRQKLVDKLKQEYKKLIKETQILEFYSFSCYRNYDIGEIVQGCLSAKPEKSDVVHNFLAFLAEQMMEMNKEKQEEIKTFLKWLSGEIKVNIECLALKTKIKEYYEGDFDSLWQALKKNERKISISLSHNFMGKLEKEFDLSMQKLSPLKAKIQGTDRLIDQIIYQLYGLTEEEIKIVEG